MRISKIMLILEQFLSPTTQRYKMRKCFLNTWRIIPTIKSIDGNKSLIICISNTLCAITIILTTFLYMIKIIPKTKCSKTMRNQVLTFACMQDDAIFRTNFYP